MCLLFDHICTKSRSVDETKSVLLYHLHGASFLSLVSFNHCHKKISSLQQQLPQQTIMEFETAHVRLVLVERVCMSMEAGV